MKGAIIMTVNWDAFNHASHAPQLRSCNYYVQYMCTVLHIHGLVHACMYVIDMYAAQLCKRGSELPLSVHMHHVIKCPFTYSVHNSVDM